MGREGSLCLKLKEGKNAAFSVLPCKLILLHLNQNVSTLFSVTFLDCILYSCDFMLHLKSTFPQSVFLNSRKCHNSFTWRHRQHLWPNIFLNHSSIQIAIAVVSFPWNMSITMNSNSNFRKKIQESLKCFLGRLRRLSPFSSDRYVLEYENSLFLIYPIYINVTFKNRSCLLHCCCWFFARSWGPWALMAMNFQASTMHYHKQDLRHAHGILWKKWQVRDGMRFHWHCILKTHWLNLFP